MDLKAVIDYLKIPIPVAVALVAFGWWLGNVAADVDSVAAASSSVEYRLGQHESRLTSIEYLAGVYADRVLALDDTVAGLREKIALHGGQIDLMLRAPP